MQPTHLALDRPAKIAPAAHITHKVQTCAGLIRESGQLQSCHTPEIKKPRWLEGSPGTNPQVTVRAIGVSAVSGSSLRTEETCDTESSSKRRSWSAGLGGHHLANHLEIDRQGTTSFLGLVIRDQYPQAGPSCRITQPCPTRWNSNGINIATPTRGGLRTPRPALASFDGKLPVAAGQGAPFPNSRVARPFP